MDLVAIGATHSDLVVFASTRLSNGEMKVFAQHFLMSFSDKDDPFSVSGEYTMKWLGYEMKHKFKAFLEKHLKEGIEYEVTPGEVFSRAGENLGGRPSESFKLSIDGFKVLSMRSGTKKADTIRSYYIELEKIIHEYIAFQQKQMLDEMSRQLNDANSRTQSLQFSLDAEKDNFARHMNRRVKKNDPGDMVYIYRESDDVFKIGRTDNVDRREGEHRTSTSKGSVVYSKRCCDSKILERVVHHILDQYRIYPKREWFGVSFDIAKEAIDAAHAFIDGLVDRCHDIDTKGLSERIKAVVSGMGSVIAENDMLAEMEEMDDPEDDAPEAPAVVMADIDVVNPNDFDRFIDRCFVKGADSTAFSADVFGAHRLWGRCCMKTTHDALYKYMKANFKSVKVFDPVTTAKLASFKGVALKPIAFKLDEPESDTDRFIRDECKTSYSARVAGKVLFEAFEKWKRRSDPDYMLTVSEKKRVDGAVGNKFLVSNVYNGKQSVLGYFGVCLKDDTSFTGMKLANALKKKVAKVDITTKQVVDTYESLTAAAAVIGKSPCYVSMDIRFQRPLGNYLYQYIDKK